MKPWSSFYPDLLMHVPGCPDILADQALCRASREFFRRTRAWMVWLDPITVSASTFTYDLDLPQDSVVVRIEKSTLDGSPFEILSWRDLNKDITVDVVDKTGISSQDRQTVSLPKACADGQIIRIQASLMPTLSAAGIQDVYFDQYMEDIIQGAKQRLMMTDGQPFYKPQLAAVAGAEFETAVHAKAVDAWRGSTGKTPRVRLKLC
jgi:hypothetical protein